MKFYIRVVGDNFDINSGWARGELGPDGLGQGTSRDGKVSVRKAGDKYFVKIEEGEEAEALLDPCTQSLTRTATGRYVADPMASGLC